MAKFTHELGKKEAVLAVKRALNGKMAVLKDTGDQLVVGSPMMTVKILITDKTVETSASLIGKVVLGTVDSCIELAEGFTKA
jgi:hypothetical protein